MNFDTIRWSLQILGGFTFLYGSFVFWPVFFHWLEKRRYLAAFWLIASYAAVTGVVVLVLSGGIFFRYGLDQVRLLIGLVTITALIFELTFITGVPGWAYKTRVTRRQRSPDPKKIKWMWNPIEIFRYTKDRLAESKAPLVLRPRSWAWVQAWNARRADDVLADAATAPPQMPTGDVAPSAMLDLPVAPSKPAPVAPEPEELWVMVTEDGNGQTGWNYDTEEATGQLYAGHVYPVLGQADDMIKVAGDVCFWEGYLEETEAPAPALA